MTTISLTINSWTGHFSRDRLSYEHTGDAMDKIKVVTPNTASTTRVIRVQDPQLHLEDAWFWTEEWQAGEREADEDIQEGRYDEYDTMDDFIVGLEELLND